MGIFPVKCPVSSAGWEESEELFIIVGARRVMASSCACDRQGGGEVDYF